LPLAAWENLARFWRGGGLVIAAGALPANSERQLPAPRVQALAREMFGAGGELRVITNAAGGAGVFLPVRMMAFVPTMLDRLLERDVRCDDPHSPLRATHRRVEGHDVYFVINDSGQPWNGTIHLRGKGLGEQWNPQTGMASPLADSSDVPLHLDPYGALLFRFPHSQSPARRSGFGGALPVLACAPLPGVAPVIAKGQFVHAELSGDAASGWRARATLARGQVDTHLFLSCNFSPPLDLSGADGVVVDTSVPEQQATNSQLLIILRQKNGGDYVASTHRHLDVPGRVRSQVLLSEFSLAGWSKDPGGHLDLSQVTSIRVGWGGYLGVEGEKLDFTLGGLQRFTVGTSR
jgi:hypothetical protein